MPLLLGGFLFPYSLPQICLQGKRVLGKLFSLLWGSNPEGRQQAAYRRMQMSELRQNLIENTLYFPLISLGMLGDVRPAKRQNISHG